MSVTDIGPPRWPALAWLIASTISRRASTTLSFRSRSFSGDTVGASCATGRPPLQVGAIIDPGSRRLAAAHHPDDLEPVALGDRRRVELVALQDPAVVLDRDRERVDAELPQVVADARRALERPRLAVDGHVHRNSPLSSRWPSIAARRRRAASRGERSARIAEITATPCAPAPIAAAAFSAVIPPNATTGPSPAAAIRRTPSIPIVSPPGWLELGKTVPSSSQSAPAAPRASESEWTDAPIGSDGATRRASPTGSERRPSCT